MLTLMRILWPSFLIAGIAEGVFFSLFDPMDLTFFGEPLALSRTAMYSLGFFLFWAFAAASSSLTCFLQRGAEDINQHPSLPGDDRAETRAKTKPPGGRLHDNLS